MSASIVFKGAGVIAKRAKSAKAANAKINKNLLSSLNIIVIQAKQNHIFDNDTGKLQGSIDAEAKGLTGIVFVPIEGALGVIYAPWIVYGDRETKKGSGEHVEWNDGKGDPFLQTAATVKKDEFLKDYNVRVYKTYKDLILKGLT